MEITIENLDTKSKDYKEFLERQRTKTNEFNKENIFFIFASSEREFKEKLDKLGYDKTDIASIGAGAYCQAKNYAKVNMFLDDIADEKKKYVTSDCDNFYGALYYELWNNEYYFNADNQAIARALGVDEENILSEFPKANEVVYIYLDEFEKLNL